MVEVTVAGQDPVAGTANSTSVATTHPDSRALDPCSVRDIHTHTQPHSDVVRQRVDSSRTAFLLWTYEGTNTGPGGSGNRVRFSGWEAWTFSPSGLVQRSIGTFDQNEHERQLANGI